MKYYVEYPIPIVCSMRCPYCFHRQLWQHNELRPNAVYGTYCPFTLDQFIAWRDKHLTDATEFLVELHGGEMSHPHCRSAVFEAIDNMGGNTKFQLQTNGLGKDDFYSALSERKDKIDRVGFTYHREMLGAANSIFTANVRNMQAGGVKVYVKELLWLKHKERILKAKEQWEREGVEYRIQDLKNGESMKYAPEEWALIHPEYCHYGENCGCRAGYKQVLIRGYDIFGGDVLACWQDHKVIGSINEDWYDPPGGVKIDTSMPRLRRVDGGGMYRSDYTRDVEITKLENKYYNLSYGNKEAYMLARMEKEVEGLTAILRNAEQTLAQHQQGAAQCTATIHEARGAIVTLNKLIAQAAEDKIAAAEPTEAATHEPKKATAA